MIDRRGRIIIKPPIGARKSESSRLPLLQTATWLLGSTFFFSAAMNYFLATWIVTSPAGSQAFNEELGRLTLMSYPMIALPSMLMMMGVLYYLARAVRRLTGLKLTDMLNQTPNQTGDRP